MEDRACFGVGPDRFDHQIQFIGAVDFARHAVGLARHKVVGFAEVMQPIVTLVSRSGNPTRPVLLPREQWAIGAPQTRTRGENIRELAVVKS
jgi:hypothetical protein